MLVESSLHQRFIFEPFMIIQIFYFHSSWLFKFSSVCMCFLTGLSKSTQLDIKFITIKISFYPGQRIKNRNCVHFRMFWLLKPNILLYVAPVDSIEPKNDFLFWTEKIWSKNSNLQISDDFVSLLFNCRLNRFELAAFAWYTFQLIRFFFSHKTYFDKLRIYASNAVIGSTIFSVLGSSK